MTIARPAAGRVPRRELVEVDVVESPTSTSPAVRRADPPSRSPTQRKFDPVRPAGHEPLAPLSTSAPSRPPSRAGAGRASCRPVDRAPGRGCRSARGSASASAAVELLGASARVSVTGRSSREPPASRPRGRGRGARSAPHCGSARARTLSPAARARSAVRLRLRGGTMSSRARRGREQLRHAERHELGGRGGGVALRHLLRAAAEQLGHDAAADREPCSASERGRRRRIARRRRATRTVSSEPGTPAARRGRAAVQSCEVAARRVPDRGHPRRASASGMEEAPSRRGRCHVGEELRPAGVRRGATVLDVPGQPAEHGPDRHRAAPSGCAR